MSDTKIPPPVADPPAVDTPTVPPATDTLEPGALEQLRSQVAELFARLSDPKPAGGGDGSAAGPTPPPVSPPADSGKSIEQAVRDVLAADDRDYRIAKIEETLTELRDGLKPPKRGWGAWLVGDR